VRYARGAGFDRSDVPTAAAIALATSGGIASYDFHAGAPGVGHYVGLWGIDVDRFLEYADADLHVPQHAAAAAKELHERHDGWGWAPAYNAGHHYHHLRTVSDDVSRELYSQRPTESVTFHTSGKRIRHALDRFQQVHELLAQGQHTRGR
jgi:hypothetical protein